MFSNRILTALSLVAATAGGAHAGDKLGRDQSPQRYLDEAALSLDLLQKDGGYRFRLNSYVYGVTSANDRVRVDWLHKGKVAASQTCPLKVTDDSGHVQCTYEGKPLKQTDKVTAKVYFLDDSNDEAYLLRELRPTIGAYEFIGKTYYQVVNDDALGMAHVWQDPANKFRLSFHFWVARDPGFTRGALRCTVDGEKLPDIDASLENGPVVISQYDDSSGQQVTYQWTQARLSPAGGDMYLGRRDEVVKALDLHADRAKEGGKVFLGEHAGDWVCDFRASGAVIRTLRFRVNAEGLIDPHPAQAAAGMPLLLPTVAMVDIRLPDKNEFDLRVRGKAIAGSMPYGTPWPKHASLAEMLKAAPKDSGLHDPGKGKKKGKKGKR